ncbi:hypothetical protein C0Q58_12455 [Streptomyces albidoflavus]|nr:hypothetical protein [Streptomyces sp. SID8370]RZD63101.1 hypothetical protein C0Q59_11625 [Streptomyces albidoflavus]RZD64252.1 hypothetical protein C0Q58_12455 [Streptomyces albidoflavus]RZD80709.1 hypothetical protein C0Q60_13630 [Streptomyces albidoflavus]RZD86733.1 hypothetical protein C0Q63_12995 [Streptomyces albidoflavus]
MRWSRALFKTVTDGLDSCVGRPNREMGTPAPAAPPAPPPPRTWPLDTAPPSPEDARRPGGSWDIT